MVLMVFYCFIHSILWAQFQKRNSKADFEKDYPEYNLVIANSQNDFLHDERFKYIQRLKYYSEMECSADKPGSKFSLQQLSKTFNQFLVFRKRFVKFKIIPPKIEINIREKSRIKQNMIHGFIAKE